MNISPRKTAVLITLLALASASRASTNGDNLLGVGASARALGGVGVAEPQDAIGAISSNPATLSFLGADLASEADLSFTFFLPHVSAVVGGVSADSASKTYIIPSLAIAGPIGDKGSPWDYGLAVYGAVGLGVDYRNSALAGNLTGVPYPILPSSHTQLEILKVAPSVSYRISTEWSAGLAFQVDEGRLDLGNGSNSGYGYGLQPGITFHPTNQLGFGLTYISPQAITYDKVVGGVPEAPVAPAAQSGRLLRCHPGAVSYRDRPPMGQLEQRRRIQGLRVDQHLGLRGGGPVHGDSEDADPACGVYVRRQSRPDP
jgi:long-chain fatty acid transport protein